MLRVLIAEVAENGLQTLLRMETGSYQGQIILCQS